MSRSLADAAFWLAVVLCAVAQLLILRSALVARPAPVDRQVPESRRPIEVLWAIVPAIALAVVLVFTWRAMHPAPSAPAGAPDPTGSVAVAERHLPGAERSLPSEMHR